MMIFVHLAACTAAPSSQEEEYLQLYFISTQDHGPALIGQRFHADTPPTPKQLIQALLAGPDQEELRSPFPAGLTLRSCTQEGSHLIIDFSEQYGGLTDIALTLADYCVVLTVCQLEGIDTVEIMVSGHPLPYRSHQILTQQEALSAA